MGFDKCVKDITRWTKITEFSDGKGGITSAPRFKSAAVGMQYSLAVDTAGKLWGTGKNESGEIGLGDNIKGVDEWTPIPVQGAPKFEKVFAGELSSFALDENGGLWATGLNWTSGVPFSFGSGGQLGLGDTTDRHVFTQITAVGANGSEAAPKFIEVVCSGAHTVALDEDGNIWTVGESSDGQLGLDDHKTDQLWFQKVPNMNLKRP